MGNLGKCAVSLAYFFNVIIFICGLFSLSISLYLLWSVNDMDYYYLAFDKERLEGAQYGSIAISACLLLCGIIGFIGLGRRSMCLIVMNAVIIGILSFVLCGSGGFLMYQAHTHKYFDAPKNSFKTYMKEFNELNKTHEYSKRFFIYEKKNKCCGLEGGMQDYGNLGFKKVPPSCCKQGKEKKCKQLFLTDLEGDVETVHQLSCWKMLVEDRNVKMLYLAPVVMLIIGGFLLLFMLVSLFVGPKKTYSKVRARVV